MWKQVRKMKAARGKDSDGEGAGAASSNLLRWARLEVTGEPQNSRSAFWSWRTGAVGGGNSVTDLKEILKGNRMNCGDNFGIRKYLV